MKKYFKIVCYLGLLILVLSGCDNQSSKNVTNVGVGNDLSIEDEKGGELSAGNEVSPNEDDTKVEEENLEATLVDYKYNQPLNIIDDNYRTYYEVFLYSFYDSDGDGIGDINGLISKLDYINDGDDSTDTDLGFNGIWLMPIMPSSTYHKYDVKDYYGIDKEYGTMDDFKRLIEECDKRGIKVIIDLVINHSSNLNPWFLSALKSLKYDPCNKDVCIHENLCREHNPYVNYYNFVKGKPANGSYSSASVDDWYYESAFTSDMPDLNLDDMSLRKDIEDIMAYWLDLGVGGFRLDAPLHYYNQDTDKNNEALSWINNFVKSKKEDAYIVAEVWTNFSKYARYYESSIDSVFNFAFAAETGIIAKTLNSTGTSNSAKAFADAMLQVQDGIKKYNENAIDAPFFTNHDVARGAGYFTGNVDKIKMAAGLNLMMSGSAFVYYGEELGMSGIGRDENKRAPMYWSTTDKTGMTKGPQNMETVTHLYGTYEEQVKDPLSIYHYFKRAIRLRNENPEIARGTLEIVNELSNMDVCVVKKTYEDESIYIIYNISEDMKEVTISKDKYNYTVIRGYLNVDGKEIILAKESLNMPPYSIVILK